MDTTKYYLLFLVFAAVLPSSSATLWDVTDKCLWCAESASCVSDECACNPGLVGDPYLYCHNPLNQLVCVHCNDPTLITEDGNGVLMGYFGVTRLLDEVFQKPNGGNARLRIALATQRVRGKVLPQYLQVWLRVASGGSVCNMRLRVEAQYDDTVPHVTYTISYKSGGGAAFPWVHRRTLESDGGLMFTHDECGCPAKFEIKDGNILHLTFACCSGIEIVTRPHIVFSSWFKSGIVIALPSSEIPNKPLPASWINYPVCLNPAISAVDAQNDLELSHPRHVMAYLALTQRFNSGALGFTPAQAALAQVLLACSVERRREFFNRAYFMVHSAPFIRRISTTAGVDVPGFGNIFSLLTRVGEWICAQEMTSCLSMLAEILDKADDMRSDPRYPELDEFVGRGCVLP